MDYQKIIDARNTNDAFARDIGLIVDQMSDGKAEGFLHVEARHLNALNTVHGGTLFTLADCIGGSAAISTGKYVTTVDGQINYLRPARLTSSPLRIRAEVTKQGASMIFVSIDIFDKDELLLANSRINYFVLDPNRS